MRVQLLRPTSKAPTIKTSGSVGYDCYADLEKPITIPPGGKAMIGLGFKMAVPPGHAAFLMPRSGSGSDGVHLANVIGVIDQDYRGEVMANVQNNGDEPLHIAPGDRYFQLVVPAVWTLAPYLVEQLDETERGDRGFGSTNK